MESNPTFEKVRRIKNEWAREASDDIRRVYQNTRLWAAEVADPGTVVHRRKKPKRLAAEVVGLKSGKEVVGEFWVLNPAGSQKGLQKSYG